MILWELDWVEPRFLLCEIARWFILSRNGENAINEAKQVVYYLLMSAPITHIVFTEKIFDKYFSGLDKKKFIIGTSFPDIRYLANLDRSVTHYESTQLKNILNEDSFLAGFHFHSVVDRVMKENNDRYDIFSFFPENTKNASEAIKTIFDVTLRPKISDWNKIENIFGEILEEELLFGTSKVVVERWHAILQNYIKTMPDYRDSLPGYIVTDAAMVTANITKALDDLTDEKREGLVGLAEEIYENIERSLEG